MNGVGAAEVPGRRSWGSVRGFLPVVPCVVALGVAVGSLARWMRDFPLQMDELEFFRATRWVAEGKVPYLDFWEHHFPLQWYLMAPLARFAHGAGVESFRLMRAGNGLFVAGSAFLVVAIASLGGRRRLPGVVAVLLLASEEAFFPLSLTYRIDGPMCFFFLLGVYLLERSLEPGEKTLFHAGAAGAALAFAGLASQRAMPGIAAAVLLYLVVRPGPRWGFRREALVTAAAGGAIAAIVAASWAALGGLGAFWNQNVETNRIYERLSAPHELPPFSQWMRLLFEGASMRVLGFLVVGGAVVAVLRFRTPGFGLRISVLAVVQVVFLATISSPFGYQFQLFMWFLALLAATSLDRLLGLRKWPEAVVLLAVVALLLPGYVGLGRRARALADASAVQRHQDHVLTRLAEVTGPDDRVLDGCGWGLNRESAFGFWFLPRLVRVLTARGAIAPLTEKAMVDSPPAAIVMDSRTVLYLRQVGLERFVSEHYVPLERAIWVPGISGRVGPGGSTAWTVLAAGRYRLVESARQAQHPWFSRAFDFPRNTVGPADRYVVDVGKELAAANARVVAWQIDGKEAGGETVDLRKGSALEARNGGGETLAVFAVPERWNALMTMPFFPAGFEPSEEW